MFDKYLRIGLGLGSVSAISSIVYWSTQYDSHLPQFNIKPTLTSEQQKRLNNVHYKKILEAEKAVGCKFYVILDSVGSKTTAYNLLREKEVTDDLIQELAERIDGDKSQKTNTNLSIENMRAKCAFRYDKKLRVVRAEISEGGTKKYQFQVRTNEQSGSGYQYEE